jgi:HK97 family phage portal protein
MAAAPATAILPAATPPAYTIGMENIPGLLGGQYGMAAAMQVPAFARGMGVIADTLAGMPLRSLDPRTGEQIEPRGILASQSIDPALPNVTTIRLTAASLVGYGVAYWAVDRLPWPTVARHIDNDRVTRNTAGGYLVDGQPATLLVFDSGTAGVLSTGWMAIRNALTNLTAANNYSATPMPQVAIKSTGVDLDETDAEALLAAFQQAVRTKSVVYLNSQVELDSLGFSPSDVQLVEARQQDALEIARALGIDAYWVGATVSGQSVTYNNEQDRRSALLEFSILPVARIIEQTLSMPDVSGGPNRVIRFDSAALLRANLTERAAVLNSYVASGVMTVDEARSLEPIIFVGEVSQ